MCWRCRSFFRLGTVYLRELINFLILENAENLSWPSSLYGTLYLISSYVVRLLGKKSNLLIFNIVEVEEIVHLIRCVNYFFGFLFLSFGFSAAFASCDLTLSGLSCSCLSNSFMCINPYEWINLFNLACYKVFL